MSNASANKKAIDEYRKQLKAMMDDIRDVDVKVLNRALYEGVRVVKKLTPAGVYKKRTGGRMREVWEVSEAKKTRKGVVGVLSNNKDYASYVNYGHRVVNKNGETVGWVNGQFMLEKANLRVEKAMIREFRREIERVNTKHGG